MSHTNGHSPLPGTLLLQGGQPDLGRALEEAIEISARRGSSLTSVVAQASADFVPSSSSAKTPVPHPSELPAHVLEGVREVDIMKSLAPLASAMKDVEQEIERLITTPVKLVADIAGHVLGAGGKRLRPALTLLSAQICGDDEKEPSARAVTCAALVELTHTTTLLHDDVVDGATMRRGKPAANLVWGNETSVLVGDYLFAQVFVTASKRGIAELMHPLAHATAQMCAGELLETQMRGYWEMTERQYLDIVTLKTGALTECSCRMGALAINAEESQVEALGTFGRSLGIAFQIVDDVFDVVLEEQQIGKPIGNDLREGAITLPMLWTLDHSPQKDEFRMLLEIEQKSDEDVLRALQIMREGEGTQSSMQAARAYVEAAKDALSDFPDGPAKEMLFDIADYVLARKK